MRVLRPLVPNLGDDIWVIFVRDVNDRQGVFIVGETDFMADV